jgi:uncharacterized protein YecE (DUF72 family)
LTRFAPIKLPSKATTLPITYRLNCTRELRESATQAGRLKRIDELTKKEGAFVTSTGNTPITKISTLPQHPVRIGCAGWNIPRVSACNFVGCGSHLERYSQALNCCEINSSFYRPHKKETWVRWAQAVPADFRFSVKMPKNITHVARLACSPDVLSAFLQQIAFLDEKLGPMLVQLPPSLEFDDSVATKFLALLRNNYSGDVVLEPRHVSWFDDRANDLLTAYQVARVAADPACVPAASDPGGISSLAYFRLHGSPRRYYSSYSAEFLDVLFSKVRHLVATARVWCIFDNTASGAAIQNALALNAKLHQ